MQKNIFGEPLKICSKKPLTGFYRDGCCTFGDDDAGMHSVCVVVTAGFLEFSARVGNDLSTPRPEWGFPGLLPGDRWCLCASRWVEAWKAGVAPLIIPEATHEKMLEFFPLNQLVKYAWIDSELKS
ncbi:MAG: DUF2237 domain-containing protein [Bacteroidales bacterium]